MSSVRERLVCFHVERRMALEVRTVTVSELMLRLP